MSPSIKPGPKHKPIRCGNCNGTGAISEGTDERGRRRERTCNRCGGAGEL